jgi:hypothetical protein
MNMLSKVRILNDRGVDEELTFAEPSDGILIKNVGGLGPVNAEFVTSKLENVDGLNYSGKNVGSRNIVFTLGLFEFGDKTVADVREDIYDYFPVGEQIEMRFDTGSKVRQIFGRVESVTPDIFSKDPAIQVSVVCVKPYFVNYPDVNTATVPTSGVGYPLAYVGKVATGLTIEILVTGPASEIVGQINLREMTPGLPNRGFDIGDFDLIRITEQKLGAGDQITIVTTPGKKSATFRSSTGQYFNIIGALKDLNGLGLYPTDEQWPLLFPKKTSTFTVGATAYPLTSLDITLRWSVLIEGL